MRLSCLVALTLTSAAVVVADSTKFYTEEVCFTKYGSVSKRPVPTATQAVTATFVVPKRTKTVTPTTTSTPATVVVSSTSTSTLTSYVTTQTTDTATVTTTTTNTETDTETNTFTETDTATVTTTSFGTSTIPTPAGFTPVASEPGYMPRRALRFEPKLQLQARGGSKNVNKYTCPKNGGKPARSSAARYPQKVTCKEAVEKVIARTTTKTAAVSTVTAAAPTTTTTVTATTTTTGTSTLADATITSTETDAATATTTTTTSTTVTTTTTTTSTLLVPTATAYAACASNNIVGAANGGFGIIAVGFGSTTSVSAADSATDCCQQCQLINCASFFYYSGECVFDVPNTCQPGVSDNSYFQTDTGAPGGSGFIVGNGPCGLITDNGSA